MPGLSEVRVDAPRVMSVLLIEDDEGDAVLVREYLDEIAAPVTLTWRRSLAEATTVLQGGVACVLLDLGLPDAQGLDGLAQVLRLAPGAAVLVLTGATDADLGVEAVAAGAQDYLTKSGVDGASLGRSIRYAVERRRVEESERKLREADIRRAEYLRLERGLLPVPILADPKLFHALRYRPGRHQALLGGDFYDLVELGDGSVHALIGDVCGHGPDEAALGVGLRIAWRTLVLSAYEPGAVLASLQEVLMRERATGEVFATVAMLSVKADTGEGTLRLAGHPPPVRLDPTPRLVPDTRRGPPLGVVDGADWPGTAVSLGPSWSLLLYTDGLIEGRTGPGSDRLGCGGLIDLIAASTAPPWTSDQGEDVAHHIVGAVEALNGEALVDDVAVLVVGRRG